jgi:hypothetical protein
VSIDGFSEPRLSGHATFPLDFRHQVGPVTQGYHAQPFPCATGIIHAAKRRTASRKSLRGSMRSVRVSLLTRERLPSLDGMMPGPTSTPKTSSLTSRRRDSGEILELRGPGKAPPRPVAQPGHHRDCARAGTTRPRSRRRTGPRRGPQRARGATIVPGTALGSIRSRNAPGRRAVLCLGTILEQSDRRAGRIAAGRCHFFARDPAERLDTSTGS